MLRRQKVVLSHSLETQRRQEYFQLGLDRPMSVEMWSRLNLYLQIPIIHRWTIIVGGPTSRSMPFLGSCPQAE
jgi:hypothetical protein